MYMFNMHLILFNVGNSEIFIQFVGTSLFSSPLALRYKRVLSYELRVEGITMERHSCLMW